MKEIRRSKNWTVGKTSPGHIHIHIDYIHTLPIAMRKRAYEYLDVIKKHLAPNGVHYSIVNPQINILKLAIEANNITFITCPDFDTVHEPVVGDWIVVGAKGVVKEGTSTDLVYLHKWLMVVNNYIGFDVKAAELRSQEILKITFQSDPRETVINREDWETRCLPELTIHQAT